MIERRSVILSGPPVFPLAERLLHAEMSKTADTLGDCAPCRGTGTVIILICLTGNPYTPVKDCPACTGTGWTDRVERTYRAPLLTHSLPV